MENNENSEDKIRFENELLKMKLMAEEGAVFSEFSEIPSEIENEFLKNIQNYEDNYKNVKMITVFEFIGKPEVPAPETLSDEEIHIQLTNIENIMRKNGVELGTCADVDDRTLYTFIVNELFNEETEDMRIPGMTTNFIYEEFHPNAELDITDTIEHFMFDYFNLEETYYKMHLTPDKKEDSQILSLRNSFIKFEKPITEILQLNHTEKEGAVTYSLKTTAYDSEHKPHEINGEGYAKLILDEFGYWSISEIRFPSGN